MALIKRVTAAIAGTIQSVLTAGDKEKTKEVFVPVPKVDDKKKDKKDEEKKDK